jgi:hypothetical protein
MRHYGMKIVYFVMLAVSVMLAFLVLEDLDKEPTLGETASIWILETRSSASIAQTAQMVTSFAHDHRVSVVRKIHDFRNPDHLLHLYIAAGNPGSAPASWLERGFSSFGRDIRTETHAFEKIGFPDPRGVYHVYGPLGAVEALRAEFAKLGLTGDLVLPAGLGERILRYALQPLGPAFFLAALSVVLTVGANVLLSAKGYGILRLQGMSFLTILSRDLRRLAFFWMVAAASITVITLIFLGLYNGFTRLGLFAAIAGGLAGALSLLAVITHSGALALVTRRDILRGIKGEVAPGPTTAGAYLVRVAAALLVLIIGGTTLVSWEDVARRETSQKFFAALGEATYISLTGSRTPKAAEDMSKQVGQWLRRADARGQVIAVYRWPLEQFGPPGAGVPEGNLLFVNDTFLAEQPILDPSGKRYGPDPRGRVRVIVPEKLREHASVIAKEVPAWVNPADEGRRVHQAGVDQVWAKNGQTVFAFGTGPKSEGLDRSLLRDPVLVAIPNGSNLISNGGYTSMSTREGIIFKDPRDVLAAIGREVPEEHISAMNPVAQRAAEEYAQAVHKLRISLLSLAAALTVLFITGIGVCVIYARRNAQAMFAKHISGWSFSAIHRGLFILDALVATGLLGWVSWDMWTRSTALEEFAALGVPPPPNLLPVNWWELVPAAGVAVLATAMLVTALGIAHRRIIKEHAADV